MSEARDDTPFGSQPTFSEPFSTESPADPLALFESESELARTVKPPAGPPSVPEIEVPDIAIRPDLTIDVSPPAHAAPVAVTSPTSVSVVETQGPIALDQVLARVGHVAWVEAVAIVEALCATLMDAAGDHAGVPKLSHISITAQGTILARAGLATELPGPGLARLLHALTESGTIPVPLRLFITKWVSFAEKHSIQTFAKELGYFARPDRVALIRAVYERARVRPPAQPVPRPEVPKTVRAADRARTSRLRLQSRWIAAAVVVVGVAAVSVLAWRAAVTPSDQASSSIVSRLINQAVRAVHLVAAATTARVGVPSKSGRSTEAGSREEPSPAQSIASAPARESKPVASAAVPSKGGAATARLRPRVAGRSAAAPPSATGNALSLRPGVRSVPPTSPSDGIQPHTASARRGFDAVSDPSRIYTSADPGVKPPELRWPQLPPPLLTGVRGDVNTMELIISERGAVERVRLLSQPKRMPDMMLLSGAKTWAFQPASKQGQSVRYRLLLSWDAAP